MTKTILASLLVLSTTVVSVEANAHPYHDGGCYRCGEQADANFSASLAALLLSLATINADNANYGRYKEMVMAAKDDANLAIATGETTQTLEKAVALIQSADASISADQAIYMIATCDQN